jgi:hypothetical protein
MTTPEEDGWSKRSHIPGTLQPHVHNGKGVGETNQDSTVDRIDPHWAGIRIRS